MEYLVAAYAVIWGVVLIYLFSIGSRQRRLAAEIETMRKMLEKGQDHHR